jgi:fatty-acyl-CoA synthase
VKGPSVTGGYFENPSATEQLLKDGWLQTGDLGFMVDGNLYISGRQKDLIILNGRNYHPQAIEWVVEQIPGVRKGNVVAFATSGEQTERLIVVAETKSPAAQLEELAKTVKTECKTALGLMVSEVRLVPSGAIPKTSSGKLQRRRTKQQFEAGTLGSGDRRLGSTGTKLLLMRHFTKSAMARIRHRVKGALPGFLAPNFGRTISQSQESE